MVEGAEIRAGPADAGTQQRERVPGGDAGRDGNVSRLIQEEPGQVEPVEARDGRDAEDAGENEPFASGGNRGRSRERAAPRAETSVGIIMVVPGA